MVNVFGEPPSSRYPRRYGRDRLREGGGGGEGGQGDFYGRSGRTSFESGVNVTLNHLLNLFSFLVVPSLFMIYDNV